MSLDTISKENDANCVRLLPYVVQCIAIFHLQNSNRSQAIILHMYVEYFNQWRSRGGGPPRAALLGGQQN